MAHIVPNKIISGGSVDLLRSHTSSPIRNIQAGTTIAILDAVLVTGFGQVTLSSLTIDSSGIATAISNNHGYKQIHTVILIEGANQSSINGEWRITEITDSNTVKFDAFESGLTSTICSGTNITMKVAPLGWNKVFNTLNNFISVYQSPSIYSRRNFLRVDDTDSLAYNSTGSTYFRGFETMSSSQDIGTYPFPLMSVATRGVGLRKCFVGSPSQYITSNADNISWTCVGNDQSFYFSSHTLWGDNSIFRNTVFFGDLVSYVPGDIGATGLSGELGITNNVTGMGSFSNLNTFTYNHCPRDSSKQHTTSSKRFKLINYPGFSTAINTILGGSSFTEMFSFNNQSILYKPLFISDEAYTTSIRGEMPGMAVLLNNLTLKTPRYEPGAVLSIDNEKWVYMPVTWHDGSSTLYYGYYLLSLDKNWNESIL